MNNSPQDQLWPLKLLFPSSGHY